MRMGKTPTHSCRHTLIKGFTHINPRENAHSHLTLNFASILINYSLVRKAIIQTGNANVNELILAYLYFSFVEMSLIMTLYNDECHF